MSRHVVLIACAARKREHRAPACELYNSPLFRFSYQYAQALTPDAIYILSAKHGLVAPDTSLAPYDLTLSRMPEAEVYAWAQTVLAQLRAVADLTADRFTLLAGARYRRYLVSQLGACAVPMAGLGIGQQLHFLLTAPQRA
jgi:Family of unknown function (DUF6884)